MDNLFHIILLTFTTLFPITNPLGNAGIFLSLTAGESEKSARRQALRAVIFMFIILECFYLGGSYILSFFGLSMEGIRIGGGLLITKIGFDQLSPKRETTHSDEEHNEAKQKTDISFSPLAMPLLAGPGAIASVIGITSLVSYSPFSILAVSCGILLACLVCWLILRESEYLMKFLGVNGANALTKIMGFILLCIGVQLVVDGVMQLIHGA